MSSLTFFYFHAAVDRKSDDFLGIFGVLDLTTRVVPADNQPTPIIFKAKQMLAKKILFIIFIAKKMLAKKLLIIITIFNAYLFLAKK